MGSIPGSIPVQRETAVHTVRPSGPPAGVPSVVRTSLPGNPLSPSAARRFVRAALADWTALGLPATGFTDQLADDSALIASELVTNAVVHAGTTVEVLVRLEGAAGDEPPALVIEVSDHHPSREVRNDPDDHQDGLPEYGRGLRLVSSLAEAWGITYRTGLKTVWTRLPLDGATCSPPQAATAACAAGCAPPRSWPPRPGTDRARSGSGAAAARSASSPRHPNSSPGSSTRT